MKPGSLDPSSLDHNRLVVERKGGNTRNHFFPDANLVPRVEIRLCLAFLHYGDSGKCQKPGDMVKQLDQVS